MKTKILLLVVLSVLFSFSVSQKALAKEDAASPSAKPTPSIEHVDYSLPYPGLLPDNPLYNLKALRDKIIQALISDPAKKAEFFLLSSDKRLNTGYYLIIKDKDDMGVLYISKSNNYMSMAIPEARAAKERGTTTLSIIGTALKKHEEIIKSLFTNVDKKNRTKLQYEIDRIDKMQSLLKHK